MPARVQVTVRGGEVLRSFIGRVRSGAVHRRYVEIAIGELEREYLPELEYRVPKVSGTLSRSFSIRQTRGEEIGLFSNAPYANVVRFKPENRNRALGERTTPGLARRLIEIRGPGILRRAARRAIREAT